VHTVAPSSISPWLRSPAADRRDSPAITAPASDHIARAPVVDLTSVSIANTRARTRATLPSTSGVRAPNAIDAIAPAVYAPMPGTARRSAVPAGTTPPKRVTTSAAPARRLRARE